MKKSFKDHDILLQLLSLAMAVLLWAIIVMVENPERTNRFRDIRVATSGVEMLYATHELSVLEMSADTVSVTVRGQNAEVTDRSLASRISVTVDVSGLTEAGEYDLRPSVNVLRTGVDAVRIEPDVIRVRVDKLTTRTVPVRVESTGSPRAGYRAGRPETITTDEIIIEGPESELDEVAYAYASISANNADKTKTEECELTLYGDAGEPITSTLIRSKTEKVQVRLPVYRINTLPLTVTLRDGGAVQAEQTTVTIDPVSVDVIGDQSVYAGMQELNLGEIDLGSVRTNVPIEMPIKLPDGVRLDEGQPSIARVTISLDGVNTRQVRIEQFVLTDTAPEKERYQVQVRTASVEVELRGSESALDTVDKSKLSIGLTLDSASLGKGMHTVRGMVAATGLPAGVTLVEEDVQVLIEITGRETKETGDGA